MSVIRGLASPIGRATIHVSNSTKVSKLWQDTCDNNKSMRSVLCLIYDTCNGMLRSQFGLNLDFAPLLLHSSALKGTSKSTPEVRWAHCLILDQPRSISVSPRLTQHATNIRGWVSLVTELLQYLG